MTTFNKVVLMGRITKEIELKCISSGTSLVDLGIAVNERRKGKDGTWQDEVHFFKVTFWGKKAEVISQYFSKGDAILLEGRLKHNRWEADGKFHSRITVQGEDFRFIDVRQRGAEILMQQTSSEQEMVAVPNDDIPF